MRLTTDDGQTHPLRVGVNTVGRAADNDIVLDDGSMSRRHAELHWDGRQQCVVVDLGSTNGTFLGGRRLPPGQAAQVSPGASLRFGPTMTVTVTADAIRLAIRPAAAGAPSSVPAAGGLDMILRAIDVALDYRKLGLLFVGFLVTGVVGLLFFWIATQVLFESTAIAAAIGLVGLGTVWLSSTFVTAVISRLILVQLREGRKEDLREAAGYVRQTYLSFLLSPVVLSLGLVLALVAEFMLLLVGRIDYLGELLVSLAFLPLLALNLVIILVAWFGTALIAPTVADRGMGIGDTLTHVLDMVRRAPIRLVGYMMLAGLAALLLFLFSLYLLSVAAYTTLTLTSAGMGTGKFVTVLSGLPLNIEDLMSSLSFWLLGIAGGPGLPATYKISRFLFGLWLLALLVLTLSIPRLLYLASACAVYLNLRQEVAAPK